MRGVEAFDPTHHRPHPPGYPLTIGLGKLFAALGLDPFHALVASSVTFSLVGYLALVAAYSRMAAGPGPSDGSERAVGVAAALLFCLSPPMLLYGPLALSDAPALAFLALALAAGARLADRLRGGAIAGGRLPLGGAAALGAFSAAAIGCRPQLVVAVVPMVAVALAVALQGFRRAAASRALVRRALLRLAAAAAAGFAVAALAWFVPLVIASGGPRGLVASLTRQAWLVAEADAGAARAGLGPAGMLVRFAAHPWGQKSVAVPVLLLAGIGASWVARHRRWLAAPLLALSGVDLAFALAVMDPADAVRYALPSLLAVAFLAAVGSLALARGLRRPAAHWLPTGYLIARFALYTGPLLLVRTTTPSPPVQAITWAGDHVPKKALVLVDPPLAPHASQLLADRRLVLEDPDLRALASAGGQPAFLLSDGRSAWPGAVTFAWPESDAYGKLTRGYYREVSWSPIPTSCLYEGLAGTYRWERGWRWLDRAASVRFVTAGATRLGLTLALPGDVPYPGVDVELAVVGSGETAHAFVPRGGQVSPVLTLPGGSQAEVQLRSARDFVPAKSGLNPDTRRLAVQLLGCERDPGVAAVKAPQ